MKREDDTVPEPEAVEPANKDSVESATATETAWAEGAGSADEAQTQWQALQDRYLRLAADFENYKKRTAREATERVRATQADLLLELLDIADNFERALAAEHNDSPYAQGVSLIREQLSSFLTRRGVERMQVEGVRFDPEVHEALFKVPSVVPAGHVCSDLRSGYRLHGRTLRPAQVAVSTGPQPESSGTNEQEEEMRG